MTNQSQVIVYSTPICPDGRALKARLSDKAIAFLEKDLWDPHIMEESKAKTGVRVAPITVVDCRSARPRPR